MCSGSCVCACVCVCGGGGWWGCPVACVHDNLSACQMVGMCLSLCVCASAHVCCLCRDESTGKPTFLHCKILLGGTPLCIGGALHLEQGPATFDGMSFGGFGQVCAACSHSASAICLDPVHCGPVSNSALFLTCFACICFPLSVPAPVFSLPS